MAQELRSGYRVSKSRIRFTPLSGRRFEVAGSCRYVFEDRVCFHDEKGRLCEIPLGCTSLAVENAFLTVAAGRSWFRFEDLLELVRLIQEAKR